MTLVLGVGLALIACISIAVAATLTTSAGLAGGSDALVRCAGIHCRPTSLTPWTTGSTLPTSSSSSPGWSCVTSSSTGVCGPYSDGKITTSNGYNTYVVNNCWADPGCPQTAYANSPGSWQVRSTEPAGNTGVRTYPDVQQLTNDWCGGSWNTCSNATDTPLSALTRLSSTYAETTPHNAGTIGQFAWDIWLNNTSGANEIMVWVDNSNRGDGGATQAGTATIGGQAWTLYRYGTGEIIWSLGAPGTFAQQGSGTVHLRALLKNLVSRGLVSSGATIAQIDVGWEICSTGGTAETFKVSGYSLRLAA